MWTQVKRLDDRAKDWTRGSKESACWDLYALEDVKFEPNEIKLVRTGWAIEPPKGFRANIYTRSSTPIKKGFMLANSVGVIDNDYRGELFVQLINVSETYNQVNAGERLAQLEFVPYHKMQVVVVDELGDTERGEGGIGSTGQ